MSSVEHSGRQAGQFAEERFRRRRRAWVKRIWWVIPVVVVFEIAAMTALGALFMPERLQLFLGVGLGIGVAMGAIILESPPHRIERWRQGAEGEKATGKQLKRLAAAGWVAVHDLDARWGNIDHVAVGPAGVFLLETKNLAGTLSVEGGVLSVRWPEDPDDGYVNDRLAGQVRSRAAELAARLGDGGAKCWVQPVVVLWGCFDQGSRLSGQVAWVRGRDLGDVLRARPTTLAAEDVSRIAAALRNV